MVLISKYDQLGSRCENDINYYNSLGHAPGQYHGEIPMGECQ